MTGRSPRTPRKARSSPNTSRHSTHQSDASDNDTENKSPNRPLNTSKTSEFYPSPQGPQKRKGLREAGKHRRSEGSDSQSVHEKSLDKSLEKSFLNDSKAHERSYVSESAFRFSPESAKSSPSLNLSYGQSPVSSYGQSPGLRDRPKSSPYQTASPRREKPRKAETGYVDLLNTNVCLGCIAVVMILMAVFFIKPYFLPKTADTSTQTTLNDRQVIMDQFVKGMTNLRVKFPSQTSRFWSILSAAVKRIISDEHPVQPAVFLIASPDGAHEVADCVARQLMEVVTEAHQSIPTLPLNISETLVTMTATDAKISLEEHFRYQLGRGSKVALVYNLEDLHPSTALLLHAFCDNENAPFKNVVFIFTVHVGKSEALTESVVEGFLHDIWGRELEIDNLSALLSRVANNIAVIKGESPEVLDNHCT